MRQFCDRLLMLALIALAIPTLGMVCPREKAVEVANTPNAVHLEAPITGVKVEKGAMDVKGVDLGQLKDLQATVDAQARDISWLKGNIKVGNVTTGGSTHIVLLVLGLALIAVYFHGRHSHSQNKRDIAEIKKKLPIDPK